MSIGERIRLMRKKMGLNQQEFANLLGLRTWGSISQFENNNRLPPTEILFKLSDISKMSLDWIAFGDKYEQERTEISKQDESVSHQSMELKLLSKENRQLKKQLSMIHELSVPFEE